MPHTQLPAPHLPTPPQPLPAGRRYRSHPRVLSPMLDTARPPHGAARRGRGTPFLAAACLAAVLFVLMRRNANHATQPSRSAPAAHEAKVESSSWPKRRVSTGGRQAGQAPVPTLGAPTQHTHPAPACIPPAPTPPRPCPPCCARSSTTWRRCGRCRNSPGACCSWPTAAATLAATGGRPRRAAATAWACPRRWRCAWR